MMKDRPTSFSPERYSQHHRDYLFISSFFNAIRKSKTLKPTTKPKSPKNGESYSKKSGKSASKSSSQDDRFSAERPSIDRPSVESLNSDDENSNIELNTPPKLVNTPPIPSLSNPHVSATIRNMHSEVLIGAFEKV